MSIISDLMTNLGLDNLGLKDMEKTEKAGMIPAFPLYFNLN